ncbi:hypothetical protein CcI49_06105 [Frankia sp. CcI49]|uniref:SWIM zinc finger family protein n=1 Tax=Frankia sp. CcI49 TaxID=1745382 RepID=UPI000978B6D2|nr:hypothetical protein [Frankia sp. CcI49]ONH61742.1 hypothetical protein CcI49_06105 [Frankia sp. CcI49]
MAEPPTRGQRDRSRNRERGRRAWWSARFLELIEGMTLPEPLRAGRALARTEAVLTVRRTGNLVVAMVRDRGENLHKPRLAVRTFGDDAWSQAAGALAAQARYAAALLAGSLPTDIEDTFAARGLTLFPQRADDLAMDCTCTDWQRPCAHLVAACHQLAETIDTDPFTLLALRGRERDALLTEIRHLRPRSPAPATGDVQQATAPPTDPAGFWTSPDPQRTAPDPASWTSPGSVGRREGTADRSGPTGRPDILLDLCGPLVVEPFGDLREVLRPAYRILTTPRASPATTPPAVSRADGAGPRARRGGG